MTERWVTSVNRSDTAAAIAVAKSNAFISFSFL
jgi:hypothetical protein